MSNVLAFDRTYDHPPSVLWRALTSPDLHARWWASGDIKPVVGHRFELDMGQWGKQPCEVVAVEEERLLSYRFATGSLDTIITWQLVPAGAGTHLFLRHEGFDLNNPMGRQAYDGMKAGWPGVLGWLENVVDEEPGGVSSSPSDKGAVK